MLITFSFDVVVLRSDKFRTLSPYLFLFVPTLSILEQSRKIELTRILF